MNRIRRASSVFILLALALPLASGVDSTGAKSNRPGILSGPGIERPLWMPVLLEYLDGEILPAATPADLIDEPVEVWSEAWWSLVEWPTLSQPIGRYYPEQGLLALDAASSNMWFSLEGQIREVLDLYIQLARSGEMREHPTQVGAHLAALRLFGEPVPLRVDIGGRFLSGAEADTFWSLAATYPETEISDGTFPLDPRRDISVVFCPTGPGGCQEWHLLGDRNLVAQTSRWQTWPAIEVTPELSSFILLQAYPGAVLDQEAARDAAARQIIRGDLPPSSNPLASSNTLRPASLALLAIFAVASAGAVAALIPRRR